MKVAPILWAFAHSAANDGDDARRGVHNVLVHTGQHYDDGMSGSFLARLRLPSPDYNLEVGSGTHAAQTARVMERLDPLLLTIKPDLLVVFGDVNSTLAAALTGAKRHVPIAHVEAGLRSYDMSMPEEVNRVLTDHVSSLLLTTCRDARRNLTREGIARDSIHFVGNPMIDSLDELAEERARSSAAHRLGVAGHPYAVVTLHRPENVDEPCRLHGLVEAICAVASEARVVFPIHPRTRERLRDGDLLGELESHENVVTTEPMDYVDFTALTEKAHLVLTDSGGIQEETAVFGVPCLTLRRNTERPITLTATNRLVDPGNPDLVAERATAALRTSTPLPQRPELWDGRSGPRIVRTLLSWLGSADVQ